MGENRGGVSELKPVRDLRRSLPCIPARSFSFSRNVGQRGRPWPRRDQRRPLLRAEWHGRRKERLHAALLGLGNDGSARVATHQLIVHCKIAVSTHIFLLPPPG